MMKTATIAGVVLYLAVAAQMMAERSVAITCADVDADLLPCVSYLTGEQDEPTAPCCGGVRRLKDSVSSTAERRYACGCMKQAAARLQNLDSDAVRSLPAKCSAALPFAIGPDFDCTTIP